jgi:hypothetical protein
VLSAATQIQESVGTTGLSDRSSDSKQKAFFLVTPRQTIIMSTEVAIIAGSSIAGAISAVFIDKLSRVRSSSKKQEAKPSSAARAELLSVLFEKNLAAEAITRVYEASQAGRIDRLERDRLLLKYKQQLDSLNQKVASLQPVADFADLTELRNNLVLLLEDRISALDKKLLELSKSNISSDADAVDIKVKKILTETLKVQQQPTAPIEQKLINADEKSIEQLHEEIVQALQHLEQVEIDKDY